MDEQDLYKLRAEEYERSFYSLRKVEWPLVFRIITLVILLLVFCATVNALCADKKDDCLRIIGAENL